MELVPQQASVYGGRRSASGTGYDNTRQVHQLNFSADAQEGFGPERLGCDYRSLIVEHAAAPDPDYS